MTFADPDRNQVEEQDINPRACRALWCAVVEEQFRLAVSPRVADRPAEIAAARRWFGSREFFAACALAGVDGEWVLWGVRLHLDVQGAA